MEGGRQTNVVTSCGNPFDFAALPSVVLVRLLKMLRPSFSDVRSLSYVSKCLRRRVLEDLPMVYTPFLVLDTGQATQPEAAPERSEPAPGRPEPGPGRH